MPSAVQPHQLASLGQIERGSRRLRILIVTHYYSGKGGGIELVAHKLAQRFAATCDVKWAAIDSGDGLPGGIATEPLRGTNIIEPLLGVPFPILFSSGFLRLRNAVRWADVVSLHDGLYTTSQAAFLLASFYRKPVILTQHIGEIPYRSRFLSFALRLANRVVCGTILRKATDVVFISDVVRQYFKKSLRCRTTGIVYNGVDHKVFQAQTAAQRLATREKLGFRKDVKVALFVGRFVEKKGLHKLRSLVADTPDASWVFIGGGPMNPRTWDMPNVRVCDQMPASDLAEWYNAADLFVLPSVGEGFPLVVQEALACGLSCLVSEEIRMACPEAAALLFSAGPRAEELSEAFAKRFRQIDPREYEERSKQAHALWDWDKCAEAYLRIFDSHCRMHSDPAAVLSLIHAKA